MMIQSYVLCVCLLHFHAALGSPLINHKEKCLAYDLGCNGEDLEASIHLVQHRAKGSRKHFTKNADDRSEEALQENVQEGEDQAAGDSLQEDAQIDGEWAEQLEAVEEMDTNAGAGYPFDPVAAEKLVTEMVYTIQAFSSATLQAFTRIKDDVTTIAGSNQTVPFTRNESEAAFELFQAIGNESSMESFLKFMVQSSGGTIEKEEEMKLFADTYVGGALSADKLWQDLKSHGWLPHGGSAALTESGFQAAKVWMKDDDIQEFVERVIANKGGHVIAASGLGEFLHQNSSVESLQVLHDKLMDSNHTKTWLSLQSNAYTQLPAAISAVEAATNQAMRVPAALAIERLASGALSFTRRLVGDTLEELEIATRHLTVTLNSRGLKADVSRAGFAAIQALHDTELMEVYIAMLVHASGGAWSGGETLRELAQSCTSATARSKPKTWQSLWEEMISMQWVPAGAGAAFTECGYAAVAIRKSETEMEAYIRRLIKRGGGVISSVPGFMGYIHDQVGSPNLRSLGDVRQDLSTDAIRDGWLSFTGQIPDESSFGSGSFVRLAPSVVNERMLEELATLVGQLVPTAMSTFDASRQIVTSTLKQSTTIASPTRQRTLRVDSNDTLSNASSTPETQKTAAKKLLTEKRLAKQSTVSSAKWVHRAHLNESGYKAVQAIQSASDMESFLSMLVESAGGFLPKGEIRSLLATNYSRGQDEQSWGRLWEELGQRNLVPSGAEAAFTEVGFESLVSRKSHKDMRKYIRRLINEDGGCVTDHKRLGGFASYYLSDAAAATRSLERMRGELPAKARDEGWLAFTDADLDIPEEAFQLEDRTIQSRLNEVQAAQDACALELLIRKILKATGAQEPPEEDFTGVIMNNTKSWPALVAELWKKNWWPGGSDAALNKQGFFAVSFLQDQAEMAKFIRRMIYHKGGEVVIDGGLSGFAAFFSGQLANRSFSQLLEELPQKAEKEDWLKLRDEKPQVETHIEAQQLIAVETHTQEVMAHQEVVAHLTTEMLSLMHAGTRAIVNSFENIRRKLVNVAFRQGYSSYSSEMGNKGFRTIQALRNNNAMTGFLRMLILSSGGELPGEGMVDGLAMWYSGATATQKWTRLWQELVEKNWVPFGANASLTEAGYMAVVGRSDHREMEMFIRRVIEDQGGRVLDDGGLNGFVPYFSGEIQIQSLEKLIAELQIKAKNDGWLEIVGAGVPA